MKTRVATALGAILSLLAAPALALCGGEDRLSAMRGSAPSDYRGIFSAAEAVPYSEGRFWRAEKAGRTSWVFGTYHDADPEVTSLPGPVEEALGEAQRVVVEITLDEMSQMEQSFAANPAQIFDLSGTPLSQKLSPQALEILGGILPEYGMTLEMAQRMHPWFLSMLLAQPACALEAAQASPVLDRRIMNVARDSGRQIIGLETGEEAMEAFRSGDPQTEADLLELVIATSKDAEDYRASSKQLYLDGDLQAIWEYGKYETYKVLPEEKADHLIKLFEARLIEGRNRKWLPKLVMELERGGAFVAVGALHLPGEAGVLNLLADEGWTITRVPL
ncbi:TraB/GumN family protein [Oceanicella sp. SM1341]|uniref:TraB/GumN family protein n=1 Tax=Oceanicella sp. SM1341 TaxID=1548889 RepID=UPI00130066C8|nr:TraB/GumN family protein [Oceanicella sp. SM1341]